MKQTPQPKTEKPYRGCEICELKIRANERAKTWLEDNKKFLDWLEWIPKSSSNFTEHKLAVLRETIRAELKKVAK